MRVSADDASMHLGDCNSDVTAGNLVPHSTSVNVDYDSLSLLLAHDEKALGGETSG